LPRQAATFVLLFLGPLALLATTSEAATAPAPKLASAPPQAGPAAGQDRDGETALLHEAEGLTDELPPPPIAEPPPARPWRLGAAVGAPPWLSLSGVIRWRYEALDGQYRSTALGLDDDQGTFVSRASLRLAASFESLELVTEILDSRQYGSDEGSFLDTTIVNPIDILQAFVGLRTKALFAEKDEAALRLGRYTMDLGNRRLVARNAFRNTINSFTGVGTSYANAEGLRLDAFWVLPTNRLPNNFEDLKDNEPELDNQSTSTQFTGVHLAKDGIAPKLRGELYAFYLDEKDSPDLPTADRRIATTGFRLLREPERRRIDFEAETAFQFGTSRSSRATSNTTDLDHLAFFQHAQIGYGFDADWRPRLALQFDYASGDQDPTDGKNGRFDTLYGARRWEFGPTGILGFIARSNLISPGWRFSGAASEQVDFFLANRLVYLASRRDAFVPALIQDPTGASGRHVGTLFEGAIVWRAVPQSLSFELGAAYVLPGTFMREAPGSPGTDVIYGYAQMTFSF
jgi:hypothetical protein